MVSRRFAYVLYVLLYIYVLVQSQVLTSVNFESRKILLQYFLPVLNCTVCFECLSLTCQYVSATCSLGFLALSLNYFQAAFSPGEAENNRYEGHAQFLLVEKIV